MYANQLLAIRFFPWIGVYTIIIGIINIFFLAVKLLIFHTMFSNNYLILLDFINMHVVTRNIRNNTISVFLQ